MVHDVQDKIRMIDEELIRLLADRVALTQEMSEDDPEAISVEQQGDTVAFWDESADEHGWNPSILVRICRGILELCRQAD
ncbi:MAG: hypothetical protein WCS85_01995 [Candidatus Peribacteraceae bacterium]|jgi:chorismate mutase